MVRVRVGVTMFLEIIASRLLGALFWFPILFDDIVAHLRRCG